MDIDKLLITWIVEPSWPANISIRGESSNSLYCSQASAEVLAVRAKQNVNFGRFLVN